jgi:hypothetical protein
MEPPLQHESPFAPQRAFVVQFRKETVMEQWHVEGRVEHVMSGQSAHFHSVEELFTFMARILASVRAPPDQTRQKKKA